MAMIDKVRVRVPATTANMGPGFDSFGLALKLYNEIEIEPISHGVETLINGEPADISEEENLIYNSLIKTLSKHGHEYKGFRINVYRCDIPMSRGLGSSAACIVAGIMAANSFMGNKLDMEEVISIASEIEGHPDNAVPAALGGMVISLMEQDKVLYSKVNLPSEIKFVAMVPSFKVSTHEARGVLPDSYGKSDCIYNISRAAMLISALNNRELGKIRACLDDKIHQPHRKGLIKDIDQIFSVAKAAGSLGEFISGSGSTLMAIINGNEEDFMARMKSFLSNLDGGWTIHILEPELEGAKIIS
jgi:homoserine kinase